RAQFRRFGFQYRHGLRNFWVRLRVPRTRHEHGRCDEATSGKETNKKALAIHVSELLSMRDGVWHRPGSTLRWMSPHVRGTSQVARRKSVELKQDFFEILAYRDAITRCDNRTRSPCCARAASGHAAATPSAASNSRRPMVTVIRPSRARGA